MCPRIFRHAYYRQALAIISHHFAPTPSLHPGGFLRCASRVSLRCVPVRAASWQCCGGVWCWRYIRGGLVFFSRPKRRTCGEWQNLCIFFGFGVIYKYIYIVTPNPRRYARFAICKQTDVSHANRRHGAACMSAAAPLRWAMEAQARP